MKYRVVYGIIHPTSSYGSDYHGIDLRKNEIDLAVKHWKGMPLYLNHQHKSKPFGWVSHLEKGPQGELLATMVINTTKPGGKEAIEGLENGTFKGLSLGQRSYLNDQKTQVKKILPLEVSICTEGARDGSHVFWFTDKHGKRIESQFLKERQQQFDLEQKQMEQTNETASLQEQIESIKAMMASQGVQMPNQPQSSGAVPQLTAEQIAKLLAISGGDVDKVINTYEVAGKMQMEDAKRAKMEKEKELRDSISVLQQTGAIDPEGAARITAETPPNFVDVFSSIAGNHRKTVDELGYANEDRKRKDAELEQQRKDLETARRELDYIKRKLQEQQQSGLSTHRERFAAPVQPNYPPPQAQYVDTFSSKSSSQQHPQYQYEGQRPPMPDAGTVSNVMKILNGSLTKEEPKLYQSTSVNFMDKR